MVAPVLQSASVKTAITTTVAANMAGVTLSASGNNRVLVIICASGDTNATTATVNTIVVDAAGVNSTLANGRVVREGAVQVAKEGNDYCLVDVFLCLEANLPSGAGNINVDTTMSAAPNDNFWCAFEITGVLKQETDNIVKSVILTDVEGSINMVNTITPNDPDCLLVNILSANGDIFTELTTTDTVVANLEQFTVNGAIVTQFTQAGSPAAKGMNAQNIDLTKRHANTIMSFSGEAGAGGGGFKSYFAEGVNNLIT